ncbi:MAG: Dipeptide transport system permease protein DppC [uncultured Thermomicrobiales bacterium]|uniref:Dipeptide transport system permease protein DppC n=1 Tax=uncultured Thermomicrobiales bacterium TaxID=1645740 RepID=A0A6J4TCV4_9BACT|nr:MAG: Dipeptide transport system permease protein DppC [uncultured Thermomicrobiales bacterium]
MVATAELEVGREDVRGGGLGRLPPKRRFPLARRFARNKLAVAGLATILVLYGAAIAAPLIQRYDENALSAGMRDKPPSAEHWLGTDRNTRDSWARLVVGGRVSLAAGFAAVAIVMTIGITLGAMAGFFGGIVDQLVMRTTDILLAIPLILLLITAASLFKPGLGTTITVIGVTSWPGTARLVRGQFLALKEQEFVTAARAMGATAPRIMMRHLFPNALAVIIVQATIWLSYAILLEASLSYLGLGVQIPTPSWGNMLQDGQRELQAGAWWLTLFPGLAIFLTVLSFNLMGDGLRDAFDPRHGKR